MRCLIILWAFMFNFLAVAQLRFDYPISNLDEVEILATYSLKSQEDSLSTFIRQDDMLLFLGKKVSYFTSRNNYVCDTMMRMIKSTEELQKMLLDRVNPLPIARYIYGIFKNYPENKMTFIEHIPSTTFKYEEDLNVLNWQLTNDTSTILGYKAHKATCDFGGRSWVAWFTPEIPFSDGPYKFNGLPGLIMKMNDTRYHYVFEIVIIEKPEKELMIEFVEKEYLEISKLGFFKAEDGFRNDIISRAKEAGLSNEIQQSVARRMEERNNPIELQRK